MINKVILSAQEFFTTNIDNQPTEVLPYIEPQSTDSSILLNIETGKKRKISAVNDEKITAIFDLSLKEQKAIKSINAFIDSIPYIENSSGLFYFNNTPKQRLHKIMGALIEVIEKTRTIKDINLLNNISEMHVKFNQTNQYDEQQLFQLFSGIVESVNADNIYLQKFLKYSYEHHQKLTLSKLMTTTESCELLSCCILHTIFSLKHSENKYITCDTTDLLVNILSFLFLSKIAQNKVYVFYENSEYFYNLINLNCFILNDTLLRASIRNSMETDANIKIINQFLIFLWTNGFAAQYLTASRDKQDNELDEFIVHEIKKYIPTLFSSLLINSIFTPKVDTKNNEFKLNLEKLKFGEEFEFKNIQKNTNFTESFNIWHNHLKTQLNKLSIENINISYPSKNVLILETTGVDPVFRLRVFEDESLLEVNATPYKLDSKYPIIINNVLTEWTPYDFFENLVFQVAKSAGFTGVSGHKHIDASVFNGNVQLLLRFITLIENNPWIVEALGRQESNHFFQYAFEKYEARVILPLLFERFNEIIKQPDLAVAQQGDFSKIIEFKNILNATSLYVKYSACALHHIEEEVDKPSIYQPATSTVEIRQFPCSRSAKESRVVNEFIIILLENSLKSQHNNEHLHLSKKIKQRIAEDNLYQIPMLVENHDTPVKDSYNIFMQQLGQDPEYFKIMFRFD